MYDPISGRFLQTDPVGYKDDNDLYAYAGEDPVNKADPTGRNAICNRTCGGRTSLDPKADKTKSGSKIDESKGKVTGGMSKAANYGSAAVDLQKAGVHAAVVAGTGAKGFKAIEGALRGSTIIGDIFNVGAFGFGTGSDLFKGYPIWASLAANAASFVAVEGAAKGGEIYGGLVGAAVGSPAPGIGNAAGALIGANLGGATATTAVLVTGADEKAHDAVLKAMTGGRND